MLENFSLFSVQLHVVKAQSEEKLYAKRLMG